MKKHLSNFLPFAALTILFFSHCTEKPKEAKENETAAAETEYKATPNFGGFASQEQWGEHLVTVSACHDCHTPKKMTANGMELDSALLLSGHPASMPPPNVNRKDAESKGLIMTDALTAWVGPWGVSYTANLTSDPTGIGNWTEENFMRAIREGKYKGLESGRSLLPPMPWQMYRNMTDDELKAIFAYLKSTKPVNNVPPAAQPPMSAPAQ